MDPMKTTNLVSAMFLTALGFITAASAADAPKPESKKSWVYQPVVKPATPVVGNLKWVRTPIDAYVLAKLEASNLAPSKEADRATLIRRLSLDIRGLPPKPSEVDAFIADDSENDIDLESQ